MISYVHNENVYSMFGNTISLKKQTYLKQLKDVYKKSRAVWRWTRSKTKLEARHKEIMLQILKFTLSMDRLKDQSCVSH